MKFMTMVVAGAALALGYVLGTREGRARYEQIKQRAQSWAGDPAVQRNLASFADQAAHAAAKVPGPTGPLLRTAAQRLNNSISTPSD